MSAELEVNTESRRSGEVALGIVGERQGFAWVPLAEAEDFAWRILRACRDTEGGTE